MEVTKIKTGRQKNMEAEKLIEALHTVEKLKRTMRHCYTSDDRKESVAEHCWRVALMAYWMEDEFPEVDINKVIKMCLIHDLGECFTGDIPCFKKTEADEETEENLLYQWVATLPEPLNDKMRTLYQEMSELKTLEAKIYKALDNMEGALSHNESDLKTWEPHEYELTKNYGIDKAQFHPYIKHLRECIRQETVDKIIAAAEITKDDFVLEIGPGIGTMTQYLACAARKVVAVEIDKALIPILEDTLSDYDNARVINNDVLKVDIAKLAEEENDGKPIKVVANLPYYITTPIIMGLFENHVPIKSITVMVQKEVADRMQVGPGTKDYGALSLAVQYYAKPYIVANVPPNCFMPRPKVGSAVIRLERYEEPPVKVKDEKLMFRIIRASFNQRRKTLANGLKNSAELDYTKEEVEAAIEALGRGASIRGEALTLEEFARLADLLHDCR